VKFRRLHHAEQLELADNDALVAHVRTLLPDDVVVTAVTVRCAPHSPGRQLVTVDDYGSVGFVVGAD